jgi:hypothetical protein
VCYSVIEQTADLFSMVSEKLLTVLQCCTQFIIADLEWTAQQYAHLFPLPANGCTILYLIHSCNGFETFFMDMEQNVLPYFHV